MKRMVRTLLLASLVVIEGCGDLGALPSPKQVEIFLSIPPGLESYSGDQPITLGIPFPQGELASLAPLRVVDEQGRELPAQFDVTATWSDTGDWVRWLLVDLIVPISKGSGPRIFLEYGPGVTSSPQQSAFNIVMTSRDEIRIRNGAREFRVGRGTSSIGRFSLSDGTGKTFYAGHSVGGDFSLEVERQGPVRAVIKMTGEYIADDKAGLGQFTTRFRFYANSPIVRIYHTMVWTKDDSVRIGELAFSQSSFAPSIAGPMVEVGRTAVDGVAQPPSKVITLYQETWNRVVDANGSRLGYQWDGWIEAKNVQESVFLGLRWPWQQHPTAAHYGPNGLEVRLIGPIIPMSLTANDVAAIPVKGFLSDNPNWDLAKNKGPYGHLSPRGIAKTYELIYWPTPAQTGPPSDVKNTILQHPIYGYAYPEFATRANLPSPASPYDPEGFPIIEAAITNAFEWVTKESAVDGDYGTWNFGDAQYKWEPNGYKKKRFWLNNGKGWSTIPWLLWLRSGDRRYREKAEAHARHVMDVDIGHVSFLGENKFRGAMTQYAPVHQHYGGALFDFSDDSEFLLYSYYLTGYERARDVLLERAHLVASEPPNNGRLPSLNDLTTISRSHYRLLGEALLLFEATWDERLRSLAIEYLRIILKAQAQNGWFPGNKGPQWFSEPLNLAHRALPSQRANITQALLDWSAFVGDLEHRGPTGLMRGPSSLWTYHTLYSATGQARYARVAARLSRAQALSVFESDDAWRGKSIVGANEIGPMMRGWLATLDILTQISPDKRPSGYYPMAGFHANIPLNNTQSRQGWGSRHLFYVLDLNDAKAEVEIRVANQTNMDLTQKMKVRVLAPDGTRATELLAILQHEPTDNPDGAHVYQLSLFPQSVKISLCPDGQKGAYLFEVLVDTSALHLSAHASTGKIVHFIDPVRCQTNASHCPTVGASGYAGQVWFKPEVKGKVLLEWDSGLQPLHRSWPGRFVAFDPAGNRVCTTRITGTDGNGNPEYAPCEFTPSDRQSLHSFVTSNVDRRFVFRPVGLLPYLSSTANEWFDPRPFTAYNVQKFFEQGLQSPTP